MGKASSLQFIYNHLVSNYWSLNILSFCAYNHSISTLFFAFLVPRIHNTSKRIASGSIFNSFYHPKGTLQTNNLCSFWNNPIYTSRNLTRQLARYIKPRPLFHALYLQRGPPDYRSQSYFILPVFLVFSPAKIQGGNPKWGARLQAGLSLSLTHTHTHTKKGYFENSLKFKSAERN